jgi:hypothetical protein
MEVDFRCAPRFRSAVDAGGGTRTHTTLPSRDFKSLSVCFLSFPGGSGRHPKH